MRDPFETTMTAEKIIGLSKRGWELKHLSTIALRDLCKNNLLSLPKKLMLMMLSIDKKATKEK